MKILCFGEPLVSLATNAHERLEDAHQFEVAYAGAEAAVAVSLAQQGDDVAFVSKLSDNRLGTNALMYLARYGVNTSCVMRSPERMGVFYKERGKSIRPSIVTYDRSGTAMARAKHTDFDWDHILNGVSIVFFSGILPAISDEMLLATKECVLASKGRGISVVADLNFRSSMWSAASARQCFVELAPMLDAVTASEDDIVGVTSANILPGEVFDYCLNWATGIHRNYGIKDVAYICRSTDRYDVATFRGALVANGRPYFSREQAVAISDLSSCGSVFSAAVIHALSSRWDPQFSIDYSTMASAFKATIRGDYSFATETEIAQLMAETMHPSIIQ